MASRPHAGTADKGSETKRLRREAAKTAESIEQGGASLATLALEREIAFIVSRIREHPPETIFVLGCLLRDDTLESILTFNKANSVADTAVTQTSHGAATWKHLKPKFLKVVLKAINALVFTADFCKHMSEQGVSLLAAVCIGLNVRAKCTIPVSEYPQAAYIEHLASICAVRYVQMGSRLDTDTMAKLQRWYYFKILGRPKFVGNILTTIEVELPLQEDDPDLEFNDNFELTATWSSSRFRINKAEVLHLFLASMETPFPEEMGMWALPGVTPAPAPSPEATSTPRKAAAKGSSRSSPAAAEKAKGSPPSVDDALRVRLSGNGRALGVSP